MTMPTVWPAALKETDPVYETTTSQMVPTSRRGRILLAEDDDEMRHLLAAALRRDGYEIIEARDGTEAVGHLYPLVFHGRAAAPPDLIITDICMPGWTGIRILEMVRAGHVPTPVILITAFGAAETHAEARHVGAAAVFDKPFDVDDLRAAVLTLAPPR
jgi:DNA-binding response OmpR family regulator